MKVVMIPARDDSQIDGGLAKRRSIDFYLFKFLRNNI